MKHLKTLYCIDDVARSGSIRGSAENLAITPSALTRKIQDFEAELGTPIFERIPQGMRLNPAGELVLRHIRAQFADFGRLQSQIADLSGVRRGHVTVATSQAFAHGLIPDEIATYHAHHPQVSFTVLVRDHKYAVESLSAFEADFALVLEPPVAPEFEPVLELHQPLCALMNAEHPLAKSDTVRLRDCLQYPIAMPSPSLAIRHLLHGAIVRASSPVNIVVESNSFEILRGYAGRNDVITFQIRTAIPKDSRLLVAREIDRRDLPPARLVLGQLRGRSLSVAASKFVDQVSNALHNQYGMESSPLT